MAQPGKTNSDYGPDVVCECLSCGTKRYAPWERDQATKSINLLIRSCTKCQSRQFRLSGGAQGIVAPACAGAVESKSSLVFGDAKALASSLAAVLQTMRVQTAGGGFSSKFCRLCENERHVPTPIHCACPCHPAHELLQRLASAAPSNVEVQGAKGENKTPFQSNQAIREGLEGILGEAGADDPPPFQPT